MNLCTIATSEISDRFRRTMRSLRATGNADPVVCYTPDGHEPPDIEGLAGVELAEIGNWWRGLPGGRGRCNAPAMLKPNIILDRWPENESILYFDSADVLFFADPAAFFEFPKNSTVAAYKIDSRCHYIAGGIKTRQCGWYNSGVFAWRACDKSRRLAAYWLALLQGQAAVDENDLPGSRKQAGDQTSFSIALDITGGVCEIPHEWNYRGGTNLSRCRIKGKQLIGRRGQPVKIAHASGGKPIRQDIVDLAIGARKPRKAAVNYGDWTVIIHALKAREFIAECVNSLPGGARVLIGLDGCRDTLGAIPRRNNMRVFMFPEKTGPYVIRNTLAQLTDTERLLFLDADDYLLPGGFEAMAGSPADVVRFPYMQFHGWSSKLVKAKMSRAHGCFAVNRGFFLETNGFHPWPCAADTEWLYRCDAGNAELIGHRVFARRRHSRSLTGNPETGCRSRFRAPYRAMHKTAGRPAKLHTENMEEIK